jgi:hypothetical protein
MLWKLTLFQERFKVLLEKLFNQFQEELKVLSANPFRNHPERLVKTA